MSMILNNVDYHLLHANAGLCKMLKQEVGAAVITEAGHGLSAQHIEVKLKPGSVAINVAISSLSATVASDVGKKIQQSPTLGWRIADKVTGVRGIGSVKTGPITVTHISTSPIVAHGPAAKTVWLVPIRIALWSCLGLCLLCMLGSLPICFFFSKRRHDGYVMAANDEPKPSTPREPFLSPREGQSPRKEKADLKDAKDEHDGKNGKDEKDPPDAKSTKVAKGTKAKKEAKEEHSTKDAKDTKDNADGKDSKDAKDETDKKDAGDSKDSEIKDGTTQVASKDTTKAAAKTKPRTKKASQPKARASDASLDGPAKPDGEPAAKSKASRPKEDPASAASESTNPKPKKSSSEEGGGTFRDAPNQSQDGVQNGDGGASTEARPKRSGSSSPKTGAKRKPKAAPKRQSTEASEGTAK